MELNTFGIIIFFGLSILACAFAIRCTIMCKSNRDEPDAEQTNQRSSQAVESVNDAFQIEENDAQITIDSCDLPPAYEDLFVKND